MIWPKAIGRYKKLEETILNSESMHGVVMSANY